MKTLTLTRQVSERTWLVRALAGLLGAVAALAALPQKAQAGVFIGVGVSVGVPPPPLPVYEQPPIPGPGYIWTPGYWAWDGDEYYWVPGTWVVAPFYGALWTPGYWAWDGGFYAYHPGYWGYHVGFYGGIDYGCGYTGEGYAGGYWGPRGFYYNRTVNHITNVNITNVYNKTVINDITVNRVSYNGGRGGVMAHATPQQLALARQSRMGPIAAQQEQMKLASRDPAMRASFNHGNPPVAATQRPGVFSGTGIVPARGAPIMASERRMDSNQMRVSQAAQPNNAGRAATMNFAPHVNQAGMPNMARTAGTNPLTPAAANAQPANNMMRAPQTGLRNDIALRSASFAPHANVAGAPSRSLATANNSPVRNSTANLPRTMASMRSTSFVPHASAGVAPGVTHPATSYSNLYRPGGTTGVAPTSHPAQPVNMYRAPATAYHPAPAFHPAPASEYRPQPQPQFRPQPLPPYHAPATSQYNAYRSAPVPHPVSAAPAPHGGGAQHDPHRG